MDKIINGLKQIKNRVDSGIITTVNGTETLLSKQLNELLNEAINYSRCCKSVKGEQVPTFDEFIDKFNLEADRDNEYFFDNEYYTFEGLYYKYAEHYGINP